MPAFLASWVSKAVRLPSSNSSSLPGEESSGACAFPFTEPEYVKLTSKFLPSCGVGVSSTKVALTVTFDAGIVKLFSVTGMSSPLAPVTFKSFNL